MLNPQTYNEQELLKRFRYGEQAAMNIIYDRYFTRLLYFGESIVHQKGEAEDIVMTAMTHLWTRRSEGYASFAAVKAFLYQTVRHASIDYLRREQMKAGKYQELLQSTPISEDQIENKYIRTELLHLVYTEIDQLPDKCRQVARLSFRKGLSHSEIAQKLGISEDNVRQQKTRALQLLRAALLKKGLMAYWVLLTLWK